MNINRREEFEKRNIVPDDAVWNETTNEFCWSNFTSVTHPFNEHWEQWVDAIDYVSSINGVIHQKVLDLLLEQVSSLEDSSFESEYEEGYSSRKSAWEAGAQAGRVTLSAEILDLLGVDYKRPSD